MIKFRNAVALVLGCLAFAAQSRAQTLADRVPADTMIYFGWQGADSPGAGYTASNLKAFLDDSSLREAANQMLPALLAKLAAQDKDGASFADFLKNVMGPMWRHPTAVALVGVDMDPQKGPTPKLIIECEAGIDAPALQAKVQELLKEAGKPPFPVNVLLKQDMVALVVGYDNAEAAIPSADKSLARDAEFIKALMQVNKDPFDATYIDMTKVLGVIDKASEMGGDGVQKNWGKARDLLGLKGIARIIATEGFDGKEWSSQAFMAAPGPHSGFVGAMLDVKPVSAEMLDAIPANSTIAGVGHFDVGGLVTAVRSGIADFNPDAGKQVDQVFDQLNQQLGFDVQKDLLESLGGEWGVYVDPAVAGNAVGMTLINRLQDPQKMTDTLAKLEQVGNKLLADQLKKEGVTIAFRQTHLDGASIHYLGTPLLTPSWAIANGNLYVGLYPEVVSAAVRQVTNHGKSIVTNPTFAATFKRLGDHPVSSFTFTDVPRLATESYGGWLAVSHLSQISDLLGVPAPARVLPPLDKLLTHLTASGAIAWTDADGLHVSGVCAFPGSDAFATDPTSTGMAEASLMTSILLPALNKARQQALIVKDASNLRQIGMGAMMYATQFNEKFPADLGEVAAAGQLPPGSFISPFSDKAPPDNLSPDDAKHWVKENSDYVWNGAGKTSRLPDPSHTLLAWTNPAIARGEVNLLYADGHVESHAAAEAAQLIEKANRDVVVK